MKTYVITLSDAFPVSHPRKGEPTGFAAKIGKTKLHTVRANLALWEQRILEVQRGNAILSVRRWTGRPYASRQEVITELGDANGVGIQRIDFDSTNGTTSPFDSFKIDGKPGDSRELARNDGLSHDDFLAWFERYDLTHPLAIIHFTQFRY